MKRKNLADARLAEREKVSGTFFVVLVKDPSPSGKAEIAPNQLALLLGGVELSTVRYRKRSAPPDIKK
jgi:hypothetical protein